MHIGAVGSARVAATQAVNRAEADGGGGHEVKRAESAAADTGREAVQNAQQRVEDRSMSLDDIGSRVQTRVSDERAVQAYRAGM